MRYHFQKANRVGFFLFMVLVSIKSSFAQTKNSLDNILEKSDSLYYEQSIWRNPNIPAQKLIQEGAKEKVLVPMYQGIPLGAYKYSENNEPSLATQKVKSEGKIFILSKYRPEIYFTPDYKAVYGNFNNPVQSKIGLLVQTKLNIVRGLTLYTGLHVPLQNDFDRQPKNLRLAPTYLNYFQHTGAANYHELSAGLFYNDRYGVRYEFLHYPFDKPWSYGYVVSTSGLYYLWPGEVLRSKFKDVLALGTLGYRFRKQNVSLRLQAGQFLFNDRGIKLDFIRQFKRADVSLFVSKSGNGANLGINLLFSIPPGKILQSKNFRMRTSSAYLFPYIYSRGYRITENFRIHQDLSSMLRQYHQDYWKSQVGK